MELRKIPIEKLIPWDNNPRKMSKEQMDALERSITEFGYIEPIVWNEKSGKVVGGHQRLEVLKKQEAKEVEVVVVNLSESKEKTLNLALNKIHGEWDYDKLKDVIKELGETEINLTGFSDLELSALLSTDDDKSMFDREFESDNKNAIFPETLFFTKEEHDIFIEYAEKQAKRREAAIIELILK